MFFVVNDRYIKSVFMDCFMKIEVWMFDEMGYNSICLININKLFVN